MESNIKKDILVDNEEKIEKRKFGFRDTVLIRVDRAIKDEIKELSKRTKEPMSRIADWAFREYLKSVSSPDQN